jgi:hypothetical protein
VLDRSVLLKPACRAAIVCTIRTVRCNSHKILWIYSPRSPGLKDCVFFLRSIFFFLFFSLFLFCFVFFKYIRLY